MGIEQITSENMAQFYGSQGLFYSRFMPSIKYTDGVQFLDRNGAGWLVDAIKTHLLLTPKVARESFVVVILKVKDGKGWLSFEDGNGIRLARQRIDYTDFPLSEVKFFFTSDEKILMLASEY